MTSTLVERPIAEARSEPSAFAPARPRLQAIDLVRGAVMILMAIDHVRVYSGVAPGGPTPGIFFTRWITNFCAPAFVFLAGTSAYFHGSRPGGRGALARHLATRGLWLIALELTVVRLAWTFNLDWRHYLLAGVLWMLGWCMILLAPLVRLPLAAIVTIGAALVALPNLLDPVAGRVGAALQGRADAWLWQILYFGGPIAFGPNGPVLAVLYSIVPWIGVMALGFAFGTILQLDEPRRRRACLTIGLGAIGAFLVLRGFDLYGDPRPWSASRLPGPLAFLATTKYPASLLFLLMTLGPVVAVLPWLERARGRFARVVETFGRVPFFFYLLHIPLIHSLALVVDAIRGGQGAAWLYQNHPMGMAEPPVGYVWPLPLL
jgi:uncharacterized membrane protein